MKIQHLIACVLSLMLLTVNPVRGQSAGADFDERRTVPSESFQLREDFWVTDWTKTNRPFDELIYSWSNALAPGVGWRLELQVLLENGDESPWLYAGYWGDVPLVTERSIPKFEGGRLDYDQLVLEAPALAFRYRLHFEPRGTVAALPTLHVVTTDNRRELPPPDRGRIVDIPPVMDLPMRKQVSASGERLPDRCQTAAVATAMQFFGTTLPLDALIPWTHDPEYRLQGIWPRTLGAAEQQGFRTYIDRFRSWEQVLEALRAHRVILCSISVPASGTYIDPPYRSMGGHIFALAGLSADGRIAYVVDSALGESDEGYLCPWYVEDLEKVWMTRKGGVGMVVVPPDGFHPRYADRLPELIPNRPVYRESRRALRDAADDAEAVAKLIAAELERTEDDAEKSALKKKHEAALKRANDARKLADELTGLLLMGWGEDAPRAVVDRGL